VHIKIIQISYEPTTEIHSNMANNQIKLNSAETTTETKKGKKLTKNIY